MSMDYFLSERIHRQSSFEEQFSRANSVWNTNIQKFKPGIDQENIQKFFNKASKLNYEHGNLSASHYFIHPIRVANFVNEYSDFNDVEIVKLALVHNLIEVSKTTDSAKFEFISPRLIEFVEALTVERRSERDKAYKVSYYQKLAKLGHRAILVKVFDKMDNLFTVGTYHDFNYVSWYLEEIEEFVAPLADLVDYNLGKKIRQMHEINLRLMNEK